MTDHAATMRDDLLDRELSRRTLILGGIAAGAALAGGRVLPVAAAAGGPAPGKITVWLAGYGSGAKQGTPLRTWVDDQVKRFERKFSGSSVEIVVQSANIDQFLPVLKAAFAAHKVPDVMMLYSGGYTIDYASSLLDLRKYVTPSFFSRYNAWQLSCADFDCGHGNPIYGIPNDVGGFVLFYNKALFRKAGIPNRPFQSWSEMLAAAGKLKAKGIVPFAMGNRDGYSAANWVAVMFGSYISSAADVAALRTGKLKWDDPKMVKPVEQYSKLFADGLTNPDARTREQLDSNNEFTSARAAMVFMYPSLVVDFRKGLGGDLALMKLPPAANGPLSRAMNVISGQDWVIPKDAKRQDLAWEFIKIAADAPSQTEALKIVATPPANRGSNLGVVKDPVLKLFLKLLQEKKTFPLLDSVVQPSVATVWYKELALAFAGKGSAKDAMAKVEAAAQSVR